MLAEARLNAARMMEQADSEARSAVAEAAARTTADVEHGNLQGEITYLRTFSEVYRTLCVPTSRHCCATWTNGDGPSGRRWARTTIARSGYRPAAPAVAGRRSSAASPRRHILPNGLVSASVSSMGRTKEFDPDRALDDAMSLEFWGLTFRVRSDTFVQTNYRQMLVLYRTALDMLAAKPDYRVLDLYAGIGTLSVAIASSGAAVTAIEENPNAVQLGRLNARINAAKVDYMPGKVETVLRQIRLDQYQAAILDPPRAGCEPAALSELIRLGVQRLVYVSCEPSTHARDLIALVRGGYRVRRAAIVDMFPQTYHIESVALLERS